MSRIGNNPVPIPDGVTCSRGPEPDREGPARRAVAGRQQRRRRRRSRTERDESRRRTSRSGAQAMWGTTRALINNMVTGVATGFTRNLEINGVGYRAAVQGNNLQPAARLQPRRRLSDPAGRQDRLRAADRDHDHRRRPPAGRPGRRRDPRVPQAGALQGQGHQVQRRDDPPQGRQEEVGAPCRRNRKQTLFQRRRQRVALQVAARRQGPAAALGVPLVAAHLCPGHRRRGGPHAGRRLDLDEALKGSLKTGADKAAADRGRQTDRRARQGGRRRARRVRPRRLSVSWPGQGPGRRRPRGRPRVLRGNRDGTHHRGGGATRRRRRRRRERRSSATARRASSPKSSSASTASPRW